MKTLLASAVIAILLTCSACQASGGIWGDYSNFGLIFSDDLFVVQAGRSPLRENEGVNVDYGLMAIGHYVNDSADDAKLHVENWSCGVYIRYPLLNVSGVDNPIQGKVFVDAGLVLDTDTMEDWYVPLGVSAHIVVDRNITPEGVVTSEVMGVIGYQHIQDTGLLGESNILTGGIVIRWRDKK